MDDRALANLPRLPGVVAAYIVNAQGVIGASTPGSRGALSELSEAQGALLAATMGALRQAAADLALGDVQEMIMEAADGAIIACGLGDDRAALAMVQGKANLGMIRMELRRLRRAA